MSKLTETLRLLNRPCRDMVELISKSLDTKLPFWQRFAYKLHLLYCTACRRYRRQLHGLRAAMRRLAVDLTKPDAFPGIALSPAARQRIERTLRNR